MGVKVCLPGKTIPMNVAVVFAVLLLFHNVTKDGSAKKNAFGSHWLGYLLYLRIALGFEVLAYLTDKKATK